MTTLRWGAVSDTGRVRQANEDSVLVAERLFAVADGMGGHAAGEVASQVAVESLRNLADPTADTLIDGVRVANRAVFDRASENPEYRGMGTTLCAIALVEQDGEEQIAVVNVGDSRVYLFRDGELSQLTEDHSLVEDMVRHGQISPEEARTHPQRNIVTRVLGLDPDVEVDLFPVIPYTGDRFLLASDGLFDEVEDGRIASVLRRLDDPDDAVRELVRLANEGGGRDNITCVVVDVVDDEGRAAAASQALGQEPRTILPDADQPREVLAPTPGTDVTGVFKPPPAAAAPPRPERPATEPWHRRVTWRVALFVVALILVLLAAAGSVWWFARNTFYVGFDGDEVTIFRGRPGGLLWFDPTVEEPTGIERDDVPEVNLDDLESGQEESTLDDARRYVRNIERRIEARDDPTAGTASTSSTSTSSPPVTTSTADTAP